MRSTAEELKKDFTHEPCQQCRNSCRNMASWIPQMTPNATHQVPTGINYRKQETLLS